MKVRYALAEQLRVLADAEIMRQYKLYAATVLSMQAIPKRERIGAIVRHALRDWMESSGQYRIERALGVTDPEFDRLLAQSGYKPAPVDCDKSRIVGLTRLDRLA